MLTNSDTKIKSNSKASIFLLTAETQQLLKKLAAEYIALLQKTNYNITDICYALLTCNTFLKCKLIINFKNKKELLSLLQKFVNDNSNESKITNNQLYLIENLVSKPKIAYVFSGQGGQWFGMGRNLIAEDPIFKKSIEKIDILLNDIAGWSVIKEINKGKTESLINKTAVTQPAIFAIQVSLVKLLEYYGIKAEGVVGHSLGEAAAAYSAGVINLKEAVYIIYHRGRIQAKQANSGKMLAINIGVREAKQDIEPYKNKLSIATINGPNLLTISGETESLIHLANFYNKKGYFHRFVNTEVPYHSHYMDVLKEELVEYLGAPSNIHTAAINLYSTVTARKETGMHLRGDYWFKNVRYPVLFTNTIDTMIKDGFNLFIEIGPHPVLVEGMRALFQLKTYNAITFALMNRKFIDEATYCKQCIARLISNNVNVNIKKFFKI